MTPGTDTGDNIINRIPRLLRNNRSNRIEYRDRAGLATRTFARMYDDVVTVIEYLRSRNLGARGRVGVISSNQYEFILIDLACLFGGWHLVCFPRELYRQKETVEAAILDFQLDLCFADDAIMPQACQLNQVVAITELQRLVQAPRNHSQDMTIPFSNADTFTTVFTSGSTGTPKALEIRFDSSGYFLQTALRLFRPTHDDKIAIFLPLYQFSSRLYLYGAITEGFDVLLTSPEYLLADLRKSAPTIIQAVPYFYESIYESLMQALRPSRLALALYKACQTVDGFALGLGRTARRLVFRKLHLFWGGRMRLMLTGAAPIRREALAFFNHIGIPLYEVYGLVETGLITANYPGVHRLGSVGKLLPGVAVRFDENQQVIARNNYFWGLRYISPMGRNQVDSIDKCGEIATGDAGYLDKDGFLYLQGRIDDVVVLASGHKVHPATLESAINGLASVKQSAVFGSGKPYVICVLVPKRNDIPVHEIQGQIDELNRSLDPHLRIRRFMVTDTAFSTANQLLTPGFKLDRRRIFDCFQTQIQSLYS